LLESLRHDRQLFIDGKRVEDVTTDPRFAGAAQSLAELGDWIVGGGCRRPADDVARDGRGRNAPGRAIALASSITMPSSAVWCSTSSYRPILVTA
jgi:hypothetical protein